MLIFTFFYFSLLLLNSLLLVKHELFTFKLDSFIIYSRWCIQAHLLSLLRLLLKFELIFFQLKTMSIYLILLHNLFTNYVRKIKGDVWLCPFSLGYVMSTKLSSLTSFDFLLISIALISLSLFVKAAFCSFCSLRSSFCCSIWSFISCIMSSMRIS